MATASPVLLLTNTLYVGGAERYVVTVANWLLAQGVQVTVAAEPGPMADNLLPGVDFRPTPLKDVRLRLPLVAAAVRRILREVQPAAVVANSTVTAWVARLAQGRRRVVPIIAVAHGWPAERYTRIGRLLNIADRVVAVSPDVRDKLVAAGLHGHRCEVVFNGVDCAPFGPIDGAGRAHARREMGAGGDDVVVINVGRLMPQKAHQHMVAVAAALKDSHPRVRYAVVGGGDREGELNALARALGVADRVRFLGQRHDVARLLGSADLFLSTSDWEGMPLSTIEGMASGLAVVATETEGAHELLTDDCSVVVPVADTDAMAGAVARLVDDDDLRAEMGRAARQRALDRFSHDRMASELSAVVARVAGA